MTDAQPGGGGGGGGGWRGVCSVKRDVGSGFGGRKDLLNRASALVTTCP